MTRMDSAPHSATNSSVPDQPRVFRGLLLSKEASEDDWVVLPTPLPPTEAEKCAQEDALRLRYGLPAREFAGPVVRDDADWNEEGVRRAVLGECERLSKRNRELPAGSVRLRTSRKARSKSSRRSVARRRRHSSAPKEVHLATQIVRRLSFADHSAFASRYNFRSPTITRNHLR